jgi:hypothetical protein
MGAPPPKGKSRRSRPPPSSQNETEAAESPAATSEAERPSTRTRKILSWVADHVAATVIGLLITAGVAAGGTVLFSKGEVGTQLDNLRGSFADQGLSVRYYKKVAMHPGAPSDVFVLSPPTKTVKPDQLRIYDEVDGSLQERFSLDPTEISQPVGTPGESGDTTLAPGFEVDDVTDVNGDGQNELIGSYIAGVGVAIRVPVVVGWSSAQHDYQVAPLLRQSAFEPPYPPRRIDPARQANYEQPFVFRGVGSSPMRAWAAETIVIAKAARGRGATLVAAVPGPKFPEIQIAYWALSAPPPLFSEKPLVSMCVQGPGGSTRFISRKAKSLNPKDLLTATYRKSVRLDARSRAGGGGVFLGAVIGGSCLVGE